jgi:hypothetical protein
MLALGCAVTAVDMSPDAARILADKFRTNSDLTVVHDPDGSMATVGENYTLLVCVSVLHHIPDYLTFVGKALSRLLPGGAFVCLQDPLLRGSAPPTADQHAGGLLRVASSTGGCTTRRSLETWSSITSSGEVSMSKQ